MSIGVFMGKIDNSGRTKLPSPIRDFYARHAYINKVIITNSIPVCKGDDSGFCSGLSIFPHQDWQVLLERMGDDTFTDAQSEAIKHCIIAPATEHVIDNNGRIRVVKNLRVISNIDSGQEIVFVNWLNRIDLWNMDSWTNIGHAYKNKLQRWSMKQSVMYLIYDKEFRVAEVAHLLSVSSNVLEKWVNKQLDGGTCRTCKSVSDLESEKARSRKELSESRFEEKLLNNAQEYFAKVNQPNVQYTDD